MKRIPVGDFRIGEEEKRAVNEVLDSGRITEDAKVREFEKALASYVGTRYAVAVNSGTSALIAGITAMTYIDEIAVSPGTKVITTPLTYVADSNAVVVTGFEPVYVDVDRETFLITPENVKEHLENVDDVSQYSFILPVHLIAQERDDDTGN